MPFIRHSFQVFNRASKQPLMRVDGYGYTREQGFLDACLRFRQQSLADGQHLLAAEAEALTGRYPFCPWS